MKYVIVTDVNGQPVYYDHPDGQMLAPVITTSWLHMKENFADACKLLICGKTKIVQQHVCLYFIVILL